MSSQTNILDRIGTKIMNDPQVQNLRLTFLCLFFSISGFAQVYIHDSIQFFVSHDNVLFEADDIKQEIHPTKLYFTKGTELSNFQEISNVKIIYLQNAPAKNTLNRVYTKKRKETKKSHVAKQKIPQTDSQQIYLKENTQDQPFYFGLSKTGGINITLTQQEEILAVTNGQNTINLDHFCIELEISDYISNNSPYAFDTSFKIRPPPAEF